MILQKQLHEPKYIHNCILKKQICVTEIHYCNTNLKFELQYAKYHTGVYNRNEEKFPLCMAERDKKDQVT